MIFETVSNLYPGVFHSVRPLDKEGYYLLPTRYLSADSKLCVKDFAPVSHFKTNFYIGIVGLDGYVETENLAAGFLFYSKFPVYNYSTAVLSFSRAWQRSQERLSVNPSEVLLMFKNEHFYVYHVTAVATLVTCPDLSDELNSFLTMI